MTVEELKELIKDHLEHHDGRDYYAYYYEEHWWGDEEDIHDLAQTIHSMSNV